MLMVQRCVDDLSWEIMNGWWLLMDMATATKMHCMHCSRQTWRICAEIKANEVVQDLLMY
jgi:hypothetical protein